VIKFDEKICRDLEAASRREWLETNGLGGFASSTICGMNTRRYHGILVAATRPPVGRMVLLSKVEEILIVNGTRYELSVNQYPGAVHPEGNTYLKQFRLDPFPVFVYEAGGAELERSVFMVHGENTTVIQYELRGKFDSCALEMRPLIAFRDYHNTTHENNGLDPKVEIEEGILRITPYRDLPSLYLAHDLDEVGTRGDWYRNFEFERERERGLDFLEDLFQPCALVANLRGRTRLTVIASTERRNVDSAREFREAELKRRKKLVDVLPSERSFVQLLGRAADQFIVERGEQSTVIAGYPWFSDWGRDTMIALPGLTLSSGRPALAKSILRAFAGSVDRGMLPNRFPDEGQAPEYNTVDATLWFFEAIRAYLAHTGDAEFVRTELYEVLEGIISWHQRGTRYGIRMDEDGLLLAGEAGVQLTWMDAKIGDWVVTPRRGKPVEIQALWFNALRIMEALAERFGQSSASAHYRELADRAQASFVKTFWNPSEECLYDVVNVEEHDKSIRPNQIFAVSLFHTMLPPDKAASVVATVQQHLLTPFGLRTLAPSDPQYKGRYEGDARSRDAAYHQGTVWPWLMGPFLKAYIAVHEGSPKAREQAANWLTELNLYIANEGVGQLPEVFDGDPPQRAGGCIAQAWTVGELLRTCLEDVFRTAEPAKG
jgi:predicted glycogen debranching enzyme